jgi:hypothetical protein
MNEDDENPMSPDFWDKDKAKEPIEDSPQV